jgi:hypothetical protein
MSPAGLFWNDFRTTWNHPHGTIPPDKLPLRARRVLCGQLARSERRHIEVDFGIAEQGLDVSDLAVMMDQINH